MATCTLTGTLIDSSGTAVSGVSVKFNLVNAIIDPADLMVPREISVLTNTAGLFTMTLDQSVYGVLSIDYFPNPIDASSRLAFAVTIPSAATASFPGIMN